MARSNAKKEPAGIRLSDFLKEPAAAPKPIYVLQGADPYLLDQGRRAVCARTIGDTDPGMALLEVLGPEAVLADVMDALRTPGFLSPRRLVVVREADSFLDEKVRDVLLRYLDAPSLTGTLCLETASWNASTNLAKKVMAVGCLVRCEATEPARLPGWLQGEVRSRYHKSLTHAASQLLVEYLGVDFGALVSAIDMLALYVGTAATIDAPDVDVLIARGHHERVWALCDAVAERRIPRAMELLDAFWAEGMVAPQIIGLLRPTFRQLIRVKALARKMSVDAAMAKAGIPWGANDRVRRAVAAFSAEHLANAYQALVDADLEAKSTQTDDRLTMETLIHRLCLPEAARSAGARPGGSSE